MRRGCTILILGDGQSSIDEANLNGYFHNIEEQESVVNVEESEEMSTDSNEVNTVYEAPVRDLAKIFCNNLVVSVREDYFQKIYLDSILYDLGFDYETVPIYSENDLKKFKYLQRKSLFERNTVLKMTIYCKMTPRIIEFIQNIRFKTRTTIIYVYNQSSAVYLYKKLNSEFSNMDVKPNLQVLGDTKDYSAKKELVTKAIKNMKLKIVNKEVLNLLTKIIIARIKEFDTLKASLDVAKINNTPITLEYLEEIAGNIDFYNLDELFDLILRGSSLKKVIKQMNYFIDIKKYQPNWILNEFKQFLINVNASYALKNKGVFKHVIEKEILEQRIKKANMPNLELFYKFSKKEQQAFLDILNDIPYTYVSEVTKITMQNRYVSVDKQGIYALIYELDSVKYRYNKEKGFKNNRRLQEIKKANFGKRKK